MLRAIGGEGSAEAKMRKEVSKLKQQLQSISMVDQFATYARVQRKINTLNQQYKDKGVLVMFCSHSRLSVLASVVSITSKNIHSTWY